MSKLYSLKRISVLLTCLLVITGVHSQISTFAGRRYYLGNNGPATSAGLFNPYGSARDSAGNLYIATTKDNMIRKVDAATQVITTIAGTGVSGYSGDGGPATSAMLALNVGTPGIAVDKNGNVYISDYFNNRIRKIDAATKVISTYAGTGVAGFAGDGGAATSAKINGPTGIVIDGSGNLFFSDNSNNVIRRIDGTTKVITTYAGSGAGGYAGDGAAATSAALSYPECITLDAAGNLYIADEYNNVIRKVDVSTQKISTVAGTGNHGYTGDNGLATSATLGYTMGIAVDALGNLYIADQSNNRIRKVTAATKIITTIGGTGVAGYSGDGSAATGAQIKMPTYLQADASGNVYIDDLGNGRIRKITAATGLMSTIAGDGSDGFTGAPAALQAQLLPQAIGIDASSNIYIADAGYYDVREVNIAGTSLTYTGVANPDPKYASKGYSGNNGLAGSATYNTPVGVAFDASNNMFIADVNNNVIRKIAYSTKIVTTIAGTATAGYSGDGGAATSAMLNKPAGVAVDKSGNLYIADAQNNRVRKVAASTQVITTIAGTGAAGSSGDGSAATAATLNNPTGVAVDVTGNVFILDRGNNRVRMIAAATQKISTILNKGHVYSGVATDASGNVFVSDSTASTVIRLTAQTYTDSVVAGTGTAGYSDNASTATGGSLNYPGGLAVSAAGDVYVADINNNLVRKFTPAAAVVVTSPIQNNIVSTTDPVSKCAGDSIKINTLSGTLPTGGTGTYTYMWLKSTNGSTWSTFAGNTSQNCAINAYVKTTTYYRRLVTSGTYSDSGNLLTFTIYALPVPVIKVSGATTLCKGTKDTLSTTTSFASYLWSSKATTATIIDSVSSTFTVTATDAHGCKGTSASVKITVVSLPAKPTITSSPTTTTNLCAGVLVSLTSSKAYKYKWNTGATTQAVSVGTAGSYTVSITDTNGCSITSSAKTVSYAACAIPSSLKTLSVSGTQATLTWKKINCAVGYKLRYAVYGTTDWVNITTSAPDTSYVLTGLAKSTKYQWEVRTVCETYPSVMSDTSKPGSFKTTSAATLLGDGVENLAEATSDEINSGLDVTVYPNPAVSSSALRINGSNAKTSIVITDMSGRAVWKYETNGDKLVNIPSDRFAAGMYFITISNTKAEKVIKFVKQ